MVGNSSIRISWGRSSANRNAAGVALGMGMAGGFPQTGAFGRFGDSSGLAAAYGGFAAQAPGVIDPCVSHRYSTTCSCCQRNSCCFIVLAMQLWLNLYDLTRACF